MDVPQLNRPWTDSPFFPRLLEESTYDEETRRKIQSYADEGYLVIDLELPELETVASEVIAQCSVRPEYSSRVVDGWETIEGIRALAAAPCILEWLEILYGRPPIPIQTINFERGSEQRAHSDILHFSSVPSGFMCGVWIALEDVDEDNGPLCYYPGSHRLPTFDLAEVGVIGSSQDDYECYGHHEDLVASLITELRLEPRVLCGPKGRAIIWAANLLHGGSPIRDPARTRHSQVTHYYFPGCLYYQPMRSDPFLGKICWLDSRDVRTGKLIPQSYLGVSPSSRSFRLLKRLETWSRSSERTKNLLRRTGMARWLKRAVESTR